MAIATSKTRPLAAITIFVQAEAVEEFMNRVVNAVGTAEFVVDWFDDIYEQCTACLTIFDPKQEHTEEECEEVQSTRAFAAS